MECFHCSCDPCECEDDSADECPKCGAIYSGMTCDCEWSPPCYPGCINPHYLHLRDECYTVEDAEAWYEEERDEFQGEQL